MVELLARHDAPTPIEQRRFLAKFEDVARQATTDIQTALHPENAAAQHAVAVEQLLNKYKTMSDWLKTNNNIDKLTNHLDESMQDRFLRAVDVTDAVDGPATAGATAASAPRDAPTSAAGSATAAVVGREAASADAGTGTGAGARGLAGPGPAP